MGAIKGAKIPIVAHDAGHIVDVSKYINPIPHVLMLTAIVVSVSTLGVALAILLRLYKRYGSLEEDEILEVIRK
jgi:multicomponent Na+:H+ antiporter subunit C